MPRPDVCKIADGEEKTSPLLYPDKITHFLLFLLKKGISSHCFGWQVSNSQACYWGISLVGWIAGKVIAKSVACLCRVESREGLEECEIISSFTRQSRTLVSTLFISLLLSHVTGNTFISSLTKCDFYHVLFLSATAFKSHTWSFKTFAQNNREYTISLISDGAIFNWALEVVRVWFDFALFLYVIGLENLRH